MRLPTSQAKARKSYDFRHVYQFEAVVSHRQFALPRRDGSWLIEPAAERWPQLLAANSQALTQANYDCQGRHLSYLRDTTREHVRIAAAEYTSKLLGESVVPLTGKRPWVVTGHQPELFHVGVWAKNFAARRLGDSTNAVGLNLIVDQDRHAGMGISVPTGTRLDPGTIKVPFDQPRPAAPWEELGIANRELFDSFPARVKKLLAAWHINPVLTDAWPAAKAYADRTGPSARLADCLAAVRTAMEHRWNSSNLELPMSQLSDLPGFYWFAAHLFAHLPRFQIVHNATVRDYRRRHKLRSQTHPVPDLVTDADWLEAPFWVWRNGESQRHRLFTRQRSEEIELRDRRGVFLTLPLSPDRTACCAVEQLATLPKQGIKLRSRALTTTLFARLFLADLFIHGIGGAKYDEITNELISGFFGLAAPEFATISATLHLPLGGTWPASRNDSAKLAQQFWQLKHQPEQFLSDPSPAAQALIEEKSRLAAEERSRVAAAGNDRSFATREANRVRYLRMHEISRLLQPDVAAIRGQLQARRQELASALTANRVLGSREFSWVLFPEEKLRSFLTNRDR